MRFGIKAVAAAHGSILAHSIRQGNLALKKGRRLTQEDCDLLHLAGVSEVTVATLEPSDLYEDDAAYQIANAAAGLHILAEAPATGRSNLHADCAGLLSVNAALINRLNVIDPAITLATLSDMTFVEAGRMVATVKIIPFAAERSAVTAALAGIHEAGLAGPPLAIKPFRPLKVALIATTLPGLKPQTIDKTKRVLEGRLAPAKATLTCDITTPHSVDALATALHQAQHARPELIILFGASAIVDRGDVIPAALEKAGGFVVHFGMPVDPGNLLLLGKLGDCPVVGAPGCARSAKENGFDWILHRLLAGLEVTAADMMGMGVGGLLMDIVSRPRPREAHLSKAGFEGPPACSAVILAAGRASRMGGPNKLLAEFDGVPQIRRIAIAALESKAREVIVVIGHQAPRIQAALDGLPARFADNPHYAEGLSTSLRAGIEATSTNSDAALVILSDMPQLTTRHLNALIDAHEPQKGAHIALASVNGKRGNPVLWSRRFFPDLMKLAGDTGARHLLAAYPECVVDVEIGPAAALDIDTPEALAAAGGVLPGDILPGDLLPGDNLQGDILRGDILRGEGE